MGKPTGFLEFPRQDPATRPVAVRLRDWREVYEPQDIDEVRHQGARCMDCGIPYCTQGCPLGNRIPTFNDLVYRDQWRNAAEQLFATNNFPEFTGRLCPAPCESACVLGIGDDPVTIEHLEYEVAERAFADGLPVVAVSGPDTGQRVVIVGSGPAGLAAAAQLRTVGHDVTVLERNDALGGLLRYGIPEFKMEKHVLDRRLTILESSGVRFQTNVAVGRDVSLEELRQTYDAVILALGATKPHQLHVEGADLEGVVIAMDYLEAANRAVATDTPTTIDAAGHHVIIVGGGDTGADCLGTAHRQGAASVVQLGMRARPLDHRSEDEPWPLVPRIYTVTTAHEEGGERLFNCEILEFRGEERVATMVLRDRDTNEVQELPATLVLVAQGYVGPELEGLGLKGTPAVSLRNTLHVSDQWLLNDGPGAPVFACGDAVRGMSLLVWAIAEGRSCAAAVDATLRGETSLPAPVAPYAASW